MRKIRCTKCGRRKSPEEFAYKNKKKKLRQTWCRACFQAHDKSKWSESKKDYFLANARRRRKETQAKVSAYLREHPCVDCGEKDPVVLDFDHVRGRKIDCISILVRRSFSWDKIEKEISKCEVRCANCHRRKTSKRSSFVGRSF